HRRAHALREPRRRTRGVIGDISTSTRGDRLRDVNRRCGTVVMTPSAAPAISVSPERRTAVDRAREIWIKKLIDLSRRNNLLYFRPLKRGTLDLSSAPTDCLEGLLSGEFISLVRLLPGVDRVKTAAQVVEIHRQALANREERNLETLFVA